jgi:hypothetical protein
MKRFLGWIPAMIAILFIGFFVLNSYLPNMIAKNLSEKLEVAVEIEDIGLLPSQIKIENLDIANPKNSLLPKALSVEKILLKTPLTHYLKKKIEIKAIDIENIYLSLEFDSAKGTKGNWSVLMKNAQEGQTPSKESDTEVLIELLTLKNIQVEVAYKDSGVIKKLPLIDQIVLKNINSSKGLPTTQIMNSVLGQMLKSVFIQENLKDMLEGVLEQPRENLDAILDPIKKLFD